MEKNIYFLKKKPNFRTFWESYQFSRILWQNCFFLRFLKIQVFSERHLFFIKKAKSSSLNVLKIHAFPVAFYGNFSRFRHFYKRHDFFWKNHLSFEKKTQISNVLRILPIQSPSLANLRTLAIFKKNEEFFWKTHLRLIKTQFLNFERFENSCSSSRILRQLCWL